ncbi:MAG TPA: divergent polysaccharide deacetylase family protein [Rhizomicrobium sp.]|jgi:hypothetical protein|nr:divergent polysaccharide deacetylase family protein [Rhizomicrobium sp.]
MARRKASGAGFLESNRLDAVFWILMLFAVAVSGGKALAGLPVLAGLFVPSGGTTSAAAGRADVAYATFPQSIGSSTQNTTEVLQAASLFPDWIGGGTKPTAKGVVRPVPTRAARIAVVIDDMGGDVEQSRRAIELPASITLSFLPYPDTAPGLARLAHREGHELLVHVPMEPIGPADPGPNALETGLDGAENLRRLEWSLARLEGYDGINNHEGSKFTSSRAALEQIMGALAERRLFFLDSRTTAGTQVVPVARQYGVESTGRDVFIDDTDSPDAIDTQLRLAEKLARERGVVIAIGHPRRNTIDALWRWCGEIRSRGYTLIPLREAMALKTARETREASR